MENLNAETVKKALECCKTPLINDCKECPYNINGNDYVGCVNNLVGDALALINQLTEDVERVRKQCGEIIIECDERDAERLKQVAELTAKVTKWEEECKKWEQAYDCMHSACRELSDKCDRLTEENATLHASCTDLTRKCASLTEENERLIVTLKMNDAPFPEGLQIVHDFCEKGKRKAEADIVRKIADLLWQDENDNLNISVGGKYYNKQEFTDQIIKEILEGVK